MPEVVRNVENLEAGQGDSSDTSTSSESELYTTPSVHCGYKKTACFVCFLFIAGTCIFLYQCLSKAIYEGRHDDAIKCTYGAMAIVGVWAVLYVYRRRCFRLCTSLVRRLQSMRTHASHRPDLEGQRLDELQQGDGAAADVKSSSSAPEDGRFAASASGETGRISESSPLTGVFSAAKVSDVASAVSSIVSETLSSKGPKEQSAGVSGAEKKSGSESELRRRKILNPGSRSLTSSSDEELIKE